MSKLPVGLVSSFLVTFSAAPAQESPPATRYADVGAAHGLLVQDADKWGSGVAAADVDDDGDIDLFLAQRATKPYLVYRNDGGHFTNVTSAAGFTTTEGARSGLWFDYDGDHDLDLFVGNDQSSVTSYRLYRQDSPWHFTDVTAAAGLQRVDGTFMRTGISAGDIDNDGFLDLFVAVWERFSMREPVLFHNNGDGTFTDITASAGLLGVAEPTQWQTLMHDFDGDGWIDIYVAVDYAPNVLWINQHDNTFLDLAASAGMANDMNDMGLCMADHDEDGDLDVYVTNIKNNRDYNVLLRNDSAAGTMHYTETAVALGVDDGGWGWGCTWTDADNDGHVDLVATNGFANGAPSHDTTRFFRNHGPANGPFSKDIAGLMGVKDSYWGVSMIALDFDRDGDQDLLQTTNVVDLVRLLENRPRSPQVPGHWLVVQPRMPGRNHRAIGATVRVTTDFNRQMLPILAGTSFLAQEPAEAFFGTGDDLVVEQVVVDFPDGSSTTLQDVPVDQVLQVAPPPLTDFRVAAGGHLSGGVLALTGSDDAALRISVQTGSDLRVGWVAASPAAATLDLQVECAASRTGVSSQVFLFDWTTASWDLAGSFAVGTADAVHGIFALPAANYLRADGRVEVRITASLPLGQWSPFTLSYDQVWVTEN